jgi:predicted HicB family RNase H-like nuclease
MWTLKKSMCFTASGDMKQEKRLKYKGYIGQFTYDEDRELFQGHVSNITDIIRFQGKSVESLRFAFQDAVNEYIEWCKKRGKEAEKPFSLPNHDTKS